ncbi:GPP34 family phosphoprotein, partial [Streptomyces sp. NPDC001139]
MTTARDLAIVALDVAADTPVEQGDLSLALAAAEVFDLVGAKALVLDGDRILPSAQSPTGDRLLDEAAAALVRQEPYESVEDWLWRRGRGLSSRSRACGRGLGQAGHHRQHAGRAGQPQAARRALAP